MEEPIQSYTIRKPIYEAAEKIDAACGEIDLELRKALLLAAARQLESAAASIRKVAESGRLT